MATSNETFGLMKPGEEIVIRMAGDGRRFFWFIRKVAAGTSPSGNAGVTGGVNFTTYTSAATLASAVQNALPTLAA